MSGALTARLRIAWAMFVAAALLVAGQLLLPGAMERRIEAGIVRSFGDVKFVRADVRAFPAFVLLGGRVDSINLDVRRATLGDLTVDAILLDGRNLRVDMPRLLGGGGVAVRSAETLNATFVIAEDDLNRYFWERVNQSQFFRVALERGRAVLTGRLNLLGRELDVTVSGAFRVDGPTTVTFLPEAVTVEETRIPQVLLDVIAREWTIALELNREAIPLEITDFLVEDGRLLIYGRGA